MTRSASDFYTCLSCKNRRTAEEMRYPGQTKGQPRMVCRLCRAARPGQGWCNGHREFHAIGVFHANKKRPEGHTESCRVVLSAQQHAYRHQTTTPIRLRTCMACKQDKHPALFRGSIHKRYVCVECTRAHSNEAWCVSCIDWCPLSWFDIPSRGNPLSWCSLCWALRNHNTTLQEVLVKQGSTVPECAVCDCSERRRLNVDHDHRCCPGDQSCGKCVRGLLCRTCNRIEGLLVTANNAARMLKYMVKANERWAVRNEEQ
jgi:hypothetical protein